MPLYFFVIFFLYYLFIVLMLIGWHLTGTIKKPSSDNRVFLSLIVAVRNEEKNIPSLLDCLYNQSFPKDRYEVIFVDDDSRDHTKNLILDFIEKKELNARLLDNNYEIDEGVTPKKSALKKGIEKSKGSVIMMTDGDCRFGKDWIKSVAGAFSDENTQFVSGPVVIKPGTSLLSKIQALEFSSLIGSGAAMAGLNYPLMCNGANLAFRKEAFEHVGGYGGFANQPSGDDVFLMQKIYRAFPKSVKFLKSQKAVVTTAASVNISELINQRKRWASKWNRSLLMGSALLPVFLAVHYLSVLALISWIFVDLAGHVWLGTFLPIKFFLDFIFLKKIANFCKLRLPITVFLICEFLYPFYAVYISIAVHFGDYSWKGRNYKTKI